jgi:hypothetical protein
MAQKTILLAGKCKWAKLYKPESEYDKSKASWRVDLYPDESSWNLFDSSGLQLKKKQDKDGGKFIQLRRPTKKLIKDKIVEMSPPVVINSKLEPFSDPIGNGSTVTCKVIVYDTSKGKGHTLESVRIDSLVEYDMDVTEVPEDVVPF